MPASLSFLSPLSKKCLENQSESLGSLALLPALELPFPHVITICACVRRMRIVKVDNTSYTQVQDALLLPELEEMRSHGNTRPDVPGVVVLLATGYRQTYGMSTAGIGA